MKLPSLSNDSNIIPKLSVLYPVHDPIKSYFMAFFIFLSTGCSRKLPSMVGRSGKNKKIRLRSSPSPRGNCDQWTGVATCSVFPNVFGSHVFTWTRVSKRFRFTKDKTWNCRKFTQGRMQLPPGINGDFKTREWHYYLIKLFL